MTLPLVLFLPLSSGRFKYVAKKIIFRFFRAIFGQKRKLAFDVIWALLPTYLLVAPNYKPNFEANRAASFLSFRKRNDFKILSCVSGVQYIFNFSLARVIAV